MKPLTSLIVFLFFAFRIYAQNSRDILFLEYLGKQNQYHNIIKYVDKDLRQFNNDSIQFLKAWAYYNLDLQDSAIKNFNLVSSNNSDLFIKSRFFSSAGNYFNKKLKVSDSILTQLKQLQKLDSQQLELLSIQQAGIALLNREFEKYHTIKTSFKYNNYHFSEEELQLDQVYTTLKTHKRKKPIVAALLSAILPGSGKWYAGSRGQAFTSFFSFALPAAVATEAYKKGGYKNSLFISSALVTSIFYGGSILGSAYSVKRVENNFNNQMNEKILFNIHFPLRRFYSK